MEEMRRYRMMPEFEYNGRVMSAILYHKGNDDRVHSFDITLGRHNLSKMMPTERKGLGFTDFDMEALQRHVQSWITFQETGH
jgi:hypothetical protein